MGSGLKLLELLSKKDKNVAKTLKEEKLSKLYHEVIQKYEEDKQSRLKWEKTAESATKYATMGDISTKDTPWPGASNVQHPLTARAVIQFVAHMLPEITRQNEVVKGVVIGNDPEFQKSKKAQRVVAYMNNKLLYENTRWLTDLDRGLTMLGTVGTIFKKGYYDPVKKDCVTELCSYKEVFLNNNVQNIEDAVRITHRQRVNKNHIVELINAGYYVKVSKEDLEREDVESHGDGMHEILEQHCFKDLDGDGYDEPYKITVDVTIEKVLCIEPRFTYKDIQLKEDSDEIISITPINHFIDYHFLRAFDGSFYSIGFGQLLLAMNHAINTAFNELLDSGRLANTPMGFLGDSLGFKSGKIQIEPGKFHTVPTMDGDVRKAIVPFKFSEPSTVLFQLLGLIDQTAKELTSTTDIMTGNQLAQNAPVGTTNTLVGQGMKIYNAIQKRYFWGQTKEVKLLYKLYSIYLDEREYKMTLDDPEASILDFNDEMIDIAVSADPDMASDTQRAVQSQILSQLYGLKEINQEEVARRIIMNSNVRDPEALMRPVDEQQPSPEDQQMQLIQQQQQDDAMLAQAEHELRQQQLQLKAQAQAFRQQVDAAKVSIAQQEQDIKAKEQQLRGFEIALQAEADRRAQDTKYLMNERKLQAVKETKQG